MSKADTSKADQQERLAELRQLEGKLVRLREKEVDLEVDCITANSTLERTKLGRVSGIDGQTAAVIILTFDRRAELAKSRAPPSSDRERNTQSIRAAIDALRTWLAAGECAQTQRVSPLINGVFVVVTLAAISAAIAIHWAFLILLVPVGATSAMMWSGSDASWQRVGAQRRFEQCGFSTLDDWNVVSVTERIEALETLLTASTDTNLSSDGPLLEQGNDTLEDIEQQLSALFDSAGLSGHDLDVETERELRVISRVFIAQRELAAVKSALSKNGSEAEAIRSGLYRYLSHQGMPPDEGRADTATLTAALARLGASDQQ